MFHRPAALLCAALLGGCATIQEARLSKADVARETAYIALTVIDWGQTRNIANHCDTYTETNPDLGRCPTRKRVDRYMANGLVLHAVVTRLTWGWVRETWQYLTIGARAQADYTNYQLGLKIDFK